MLVLNKNVAGAGGPLPNIGMPGLALDTHAQSDKNEQENVIQ